MRATRRDGCIEIHIGGTPGAGKSVMANLVATLAQHEGYETRVVHDVMTDAAIERLKRSYPRLCLIYDGVQPRPATARRPAAWRALLSSIRRAGYAAAG